MADGGGGVNIVIDQASAAPPFEQIKQQVVAARADGTLPTGHRLPPVRQLAADLGLAPNTVARAYRELEAEGVIETRGRHGSFVVGLTDQLVQARAAADAFASEMRRLGVACDDAVTLVRSAM